MTDFRKQWNDACKAAGLVSIGKDTAAKLLAIVYVLGGEREAFTHNEKLKSDIEYIQEVYGFQGNEVPNKDVANLFRKYVVELDFFYSINKSMAPSMGKETDGRKLQHKYLKKKLEAI